MKYKRFGKKLSKEVVDKIVAEFARYNELVGRFLLELEEDEECQKAEQKSSYPPSTESKMF